MCSERRKSIWKNEKGRKYYGSGFKIARIAMVSEQLGTKGTFRLFVSSAQVDRGEDRPARFIIIAPDDFSAYSGNVP